MNLCNAYALVASGFVNKLDKGGNPYFEHCLAVMNGLPKGLPEYVYVAALAHDFIEDIPNGENILRDNGADDQTIYLIKLVSKLGESYKDYKKKVCSNYYSMLIKKSDLQHNMNLLRLSTLSNIDLKRVGKYHEFYSEIERELRGINV